MMGFWVALVIVFVMGAAMQRGNTCTVVAFDDLVHRRSAVRLLSILYAGVFVAGGLTVLSLLTGFTPKARLFPISWWSVAGGVLLGAGAVVAGACTNGTLSRIGSGEYIYLLTMLGFFVGCFLAHRYGPATAIHQSAIATTVSVDHRLPAVLGSAVVIALTVGRRGGRRQESFRDFLRDAWDPRTATLIIGVLFVVLVQVYGPWGYTDVLGDASAATGDHLGQRLLLVAALLAGAITAGKTCTRAKLIGPLKGKAIRCTVGGVLMGTGFRLGPGSFGELTFFGQPLLLPYAWVVAAAAYPTILLGVIFLRSRYGAWIKTRQG